MTNRIYPDWEQIKLQKSKLTEGELSLLRYLDKYLPRDNNWSEKQPLHEYKGWIIFAQPFLNGSRPDIIILNPEVGMVIYEVKDWKLMHYQFDGEQCFINIENSKQEIKHPKKQVAYYKKKIIEQLIPELGEHIDINKNAYGTIKTAIYFHKATTAECNEKFKGNQLKHTPIFGYDLLTEVNLDKIAPDVLRPKSIYWDEKFNKQILFWLTPPQHSFMDSKPITLYGNQNKIAKPLSGHHRVRGVAGSGKTQALAYRAARLASEGHTVLIVCFNITLWHHIMDLISKTPFNFDLNKFQFNHFHGICKDIMNDAGVVWPLGPEKENYQNELDFEYDLEQFFKSKVPAIVESIILERLLEVTLYDAILIDEGQDFYYEWYKLLSNYFISNRDELLIVCDKRQNIYSRESDWLDKRTTKIGLDKFKEPYIDLTTSFRFSEKVLSIANEFSQQFNLNQELKIKKQESSLNIFSGSHIVWLNIKEEEDWKYYVENAFNRLTKENQSPSDICILVHSHKIGFETIDIFEPRKIGINHVFKIDNTTTNKKSFWMGDGRLKICTIHSFKGWEISNIVLLIPEYHTEMTESMDAIIYTAITRTKTNLIILNQNKRYNNFGDAFPKKWHEQ